MPAFGSAVPDVRTTPWMPTNLPVPPVMVPALAVVSFPDPGFCATVLVHRFHETSHIRRIHFTRHGL